MSFQKEERILNHRELVLGGTITPGVELMDTVQKWFGQFAVDQQLGQGISRGKATKAKWTTLVREDTRSARVKEA